MDSNHYEATNLMGCPGQQFSTAPSFALWTYLPPCWHTFLIYLVRLLLVLLGLPLILPLFCLALAVLLPMGVLCLPCLCYCEDMEETTIGQIAQKLAFSAAAIILFLLWFPLALALSPIALILSLTKVIEFEWWVYFVGPAIYPIFIVAFIGTDDD
jgi:hypothetical protein